MDKAERHSILAGLSSIEAETLLHDWSFWARPKQLKPQGLWSIWAIFAGRGFGKTRVGAETCHSWVEEHRDSEERYLLRIALVAETASDARDVLVEGESGLIACNKPWFRLVYEPSKRRITWYDKKSGRKLAQGTLYSGKEPEQFRGPQFHKAWVDELAKYVYPVEAWDNLELGVRLGDNPQIIVTTTPKPLPIIIDMTKDPDAIITVGSSYENLENLSPRFIKRVLQKYEGTRLGEQEVHARILTDVPNALWTTDIIARNRIGRYNKEKYLKIAIGVDPAVTSTEDSDEVGITVNGVMYNEQHKWLEGHLIEDLSGIYSPREWTTVVARAYHDWGADAVVAEANNGGDLVSDAIYTADSRIPVKLVRASRGKHVRAEPVAGMAERNRIKYCGTFGMLESQLTSFSRTGYMGGVSPDRAESHIWAMKHLLFDDAGEEFNASDWAILRA